MPVSFTFTFTVDAPDVQAITLNGAKDAVLVTLPAVNATLRAATIAAQTYSGTPYTKPLVLGGADASKFTLSRGGVLPCDLMVGATSLVSGTYALSLTAP